MIAGATAHLAVSVVPLAAEVLAQAPADEDVSPGLLGFLVTFGVAMAVVLLILSFNRQMRRLNANERHARYEAAERAEAAEAAQAEAAQETAADGEVPTPDAATEGDPRAGASPVDGEPRDRP
ncbi:hypothetical protein [Serinibacter salmoneus]|uniref:Uncharacterized protein n=1 Tax=Serinibacter salmoneus TaxID=556530 RepID=A0A2A9D3L3_9MICO|nr:hypothetical protein [Serinibacter salmoneus]PFG20429.1 hypothetical protein ATL40_2027 [Serinibacter salmoneus]